MGIRMGIALAMLLLSTACGSNVAPPQNLSASATTSNTATTSTTSGFVAADPAPSTSSTEVRSVFAQPECVAGSSARPARPLNESEMRTVQEWISTSPATKGQASYSQGREDQGLVEVNFFSHAAGRAAAAATHEKWGRSVCVLVADHPYPKGAWPDATKCVPLSPAAPDRNISTEVRLDTSSVRRGVTATGVATVTNNGPTEVEFFGAEGPQGALVVPGQSDPIARDFGAHTAVGYSYRISPGGAVEMPVTVPTNDCRPDKDYAVPAGAYEVLVAGGRLGPAARVPLTVTD